MDRRTLVAPGPPACRIPGPFVLRGRPVARPRLRCMPQVRSIRSSRTRAASVSLRPMRRRPSPVRRRAIPFRLHGGRSRSDRSDEIRGPPLPCRRCGTAPPRDPHRAMEGPDPGRGSSYRGSGTGPPLEIFPPGVQPSRADRFPSFATQRSPVRPAGAFENPGAGSPSAPSGILRHGNVEGAFRVPRRRIVPSTILLLDDVYTSGATAEACARALKCAGAASIVVVTVARTVS